MVGAIPSGDPIAKTRATFPALILARSFDFRIASDSMLVIRYTSLGVDEGLHVSILVERGRWGGGFFDTVVPKELVHGPGVATDII